MAQEGVRPGCEVIFTRGVLALHGSLELTGVFTFTDTSYTDLYADDLYDFQHYLNLCWYGCADCRASAGDVKCLLLHADDDILCF